MKLIEEIGGYRELDLRTGLEYYPGEEVARLNSGRAGIYHAARVLGKRSVLLPYYECSSVREFLLRKGIDVAYYSVTKDLRPQLPQKIQADTALLLVNYFGLIPNAELENNCQKYGSVIVDNTQAFFAQPIAGALSVYSPRKFFGVPDGSYVIGEGAERYLEEYAQDCSGDTAAFLLRRIESGGDKNYPLSLENERRLERSDIKSMSKLTRALLDNIDYESCLKKRSANFKLAKSIFQSINNLPPSLLEGSDASAAPMVYPLLLENESIRQHLKSNHIFVGQWWKSLLKELGAASTEAYYSRYLLPLPIDQRYSEPHLLQMAKVITCFLEKTD